LHLLAILMAIRLRDHFVDGSAAIAELEATLSAQAAMELEHTSDLVASAHRFHRALEDHMIGHRHHEMKRRQHRVDHLRHDDVVQHAAHELHQGPAGAPRGFPNVNKRGNPTGATSAVAHSVAAKTAAQPDGDKSAFEDGDKSAFEDKDRDGAVARDGAIPSDSDRHGANTAVQSVSKSETGINEGGGVASEFEDRGGAVAHTGAISKVSDRDGTTSVVQSVKPKKRRGSSDRGNGGHDAGSAYEDVAEGKSAFGDAANNNEKLEFVAKKKFNAQAASAQSPDENDPEHSVVAATIVPKQVPRRSLGPAKIVENQPVDDAELSAVPQEVVEDLEDVIQQRGRKGSNQANKRGAIDTTATDDGDEDELESSLEVSPHQPDISKCDLKTSSARLTDTDVVLGRLSDCIKELQRQAKDAMTARQRSTIANQEYVNKYGEVLDTLQTIGTLRKANRAFKNDHERIRKALRKKVAQIKRRFEAMAGVKPDGNDGAAMKRPRRKGRPFVLDDV